MYGLVRRGGHLEMPPVLEPATVCEIAARLGIAAIAEAIAALKMRTI